MDWSAYGYAQHDLDWARASVAAIFPGADSQMLEDAMVILLESGLPQKEPSDDERLAA